MVCHFGNCRVCQTATTQQRHSNDTATTQQRHRECCQGTLNHTNVQTHHNLNKIRIHNLNHNLHATIPTSSTTISTPQSPQSQPQSPQSPQSRGVASVKAYLQSDHAFYIIAAMGTYISCSVVGGILIHLHGAYCGLNPMKPQEWLSNIAFMSSDACKTLNYMGQLLLNTKIL